jgi:catechol 2,3-dioxygenase-like lactoylglutathione lyase family enzyme
LPGETVSASGRPTEALAVRGHHHLAIQVKDLARAEAFYIEVLGLKLVRRWPYEDGRAGERSLWLSVGSGEEFIALEACDVDRLPTPFRDPHGGLHVLALRIPARDRTRWERHLQEKSVEVVHRTRWTIYFRDPEGNRIGLSHYPDEA